MGGEKPIIRVALNHPGPPHANKIFKEFEEIFDCRESSVCARVDGRRAAGGGKGIACLSGCLTRCEEQTLWKAGRRGKCAGNDPFLPSCLPNLLCVKQPDMQGNCKLQIGDCELQIADLRLPAGCDFFRVQKLGRKAVGVQARRAKSPFRERQRRSIIQPRVAAAAKRRRLPWVCVPK